MIQVQCQLVEADVGECILNSQSDRREPHIIMCGLSLFFQQNPQTQTPMFEITDECPGVLWTPKLSFFTYCFINWFIWWSLHNVAHLTPTFQILVNEP